MELIPINIVIADRTYRIRIDPKDEGTIRAALKVINDKIIEYKTHLAGKDMQDYVSMVLIWYATQNEGKDNPLQDKNIAEALQKMELLLDKAL
ncbi:MAG TPA: cell division protein ZapA [Ferruginibacter sp.]|nr:cell division protein ZapA [Ferruginibacter sp.]